jgi:acetyl-CoA acetyltransferase
MHRKAAIVGIGQTEFSTNSGRSEWTLALEAILAACRDAGIAPCEIDGLVRYSYDNVNPAMLARTLGVRDLRWYGELPFGGIAQSGVVAQAAAAIAAGIAETVIVWRALNERSGVRYGRAERNIAAAGELVEAAGDRAPGGQFCGPYGLLVPGQAMALWAQRYCFEVGIDTGTLSEAMCRLAVQQRAYANANPAAMFRDRRLDRAGYMAGRMISTPLRLFDYCLESDGAAAMVLTSAETARALRPDPVYVLAAHQGMVAHAEPSRVYPESLTRFGGEGNIAKLYADARVAPAEIDCAMFYDATSFAAMVNLETYGFVPQGTAWRHMIEEGIGPDSRLPVNTHGGHLSEGYIHGMNHLTEAVRQLRGTAANQVPGATVALIGNNAASSAILGR